MKDEEVHEALAELERALKNLPEASDAMLRQLVLMSLEGDAPTVLREIERRGYEIVFAPIVPAERVANFQRFAQETK